MYGSNLPEPGVFRGTIIGRRALILILFCAWIGGTIEPARAQSGAGIAVRTSPEALGIFQEDEILRGADYDRFAWLEITQSGLDRLDGSGLQFERIDGGTELGINVYRFDPLAGLPSFPQGLGIDTAPAEEDLWLVQLIGPVRADWLAAMDDLGLTRIQYHAENSYLVWASDDQIEMLTGASFVRWIGQYAPAYRLAPELLGRSGLLRVTLLAFEPAMDSIRSGLDAVDATLLSEDPARGLERYLILEIDASRLAALASIPGIIAASAGERQAMELDEMSDKILAGMVSGSQPQPIPPRYAAGFLSPIGYDGNGVVVHVNDAGIREQHADLTTGRMVAEYGNSQNHHGTHVAGIILGLGAGGIGDTAGGGSWHYGLGVAPGAQYIDEYFGCPPASCTEHAISNGANVSNNSWGYGGAGGIHYGVGYTTNARIWDELMLDAHPGQPGPQALTVVSAAGNGGGPSQRIGEPWEAKNVISVAASRNWRNGNGYQGSGNIDSLASFSSRGSCRDGRNCPVVTAPGQYVVSARYSSSGCGAQAAPNSNTHSVCSGTSMASPHVAGAVALITEWWRDNHGNVYPSPAMVRALLVNGAIDMGTSNIPTIGEGWGRVHVGNSIDPGIATLRWDLPTTFHDTGDSWTVQVSPSSTGQPMKVTLAWSDAPGPGNGGSTAAWVNNLDLSVQRGASLWRGNAFNNGWSTTGGSFDGKNNLENVYLQNPVGSVHTITVLGANIAGDGVLGNADSSDQDWALVCQNCVIAGSNTPTPSPTDTPEVTASATPTDTPEDNPSATATPTRRDSFITSTPSPMPSPSPSATPQATPTASLTPSATSTATASSTASPSPSPSPSASSTSTPSATPTPSATLTPIPTPSATATSTLEPSPTATMLPSPTPTPWPTSTQTPQPSASPTATTASTQTPGGKPSRTPTSPASPTSPKFLGSDPTGPARHRTTRSRMKPETKWLPIASRGSIAW